LSESASAFRSDGRWLQGGLAAALATTLLAACAGTPARDGPWASGAIGTYTVAARVDHEIARYYLEDYPAPHATDWRSDIATYERSVEARSADRDTFREIAADSGSTDLSALLFLHRLQRDADNRRLAHCLEEVDSRLRDDGAWTELAIARDRFHVLLVPGWLHEDQATTEADFQRTRAALRHAGINHTLLPTPQDGTVEENARQLAEYVRTSDEAEIIIVSASKSGAEVHHALGHLLSPTEAEPVRAWINAGGMIHGTALANAWTRLPRSLVARPLMAWQGWSWESLRSLRTDRAEARLQSSELPPDLLVINYVAVPMASQMTHGAERRHRHLSRFGPNDGATLLMDAKVDTGLTLAEPGADHYFLRIDIGRRTLAMTRVIQLLVDDAPCPALAQPDDN